MTHSAEPDDEQPHQSGSHARPEADDAPAQAAPRSSSRWITVALAVISVAALGVAIWALMRPAVDAPPSATPQQINEAKARACDAYGRVLAAFVTQTRADTGADPVAAQLVGANARLAMAVGSQHLSDNLSPAVPPELADLLRSVSKDLQDLTINALAGAPDGDTGQVARLRELQTTQGRIEELCK